MCYLTYYDCICGRTKASLCTAWSAWRGPACQPLWCPRTQRRSWWQHPQVNVLDVLVHLTVSSADLHCGMYIKGIYYSLKKQLGFLPYTWNLVQIFWSAFVLALLLLHTLLGCVLCLIEWSFLNPWLADLFCLIPSVYLCSLVGRVWSWSSSRRERVSVCG